MFGSLEIISVFAGVFFLWFASAATKRFQQVELSYGGSGRLAGAMYGSAVIIAGVIALEVAVQWAMRTGGADLGGLANALIEGPTLAAPVIVFLGAGGLITVRAEGLAPPSPFLGRLALATSAAFGVLAGLQLFKNYAWINETTYLTFTAWILVMSIIGIARWGALDGDSISRTGSLRRPHRPCPRFRQQRRHLLASRQLASASPLARQVNGEELRIRK